MRLIAFAKSSHSPILTHHLLLRCVLLATTLNIYILDDDNLQYRNATQYAIVPKHSPRVVVVCARTQDATAINL